MNELFASPNYAAAIGVVGMFLCIAIIAVGCTVAVQWRQARQTEVEADLKREMIARGLTPDDIAKILGASSKPAEETSQATKLAEQGMSADDILKIIKAT